MRTTLDLPDETFRQLKAEAALRGQTLKDFVCLLIEKGLAGGAGETMERRARSPLPVLRPRTGVTHPALGNAELESLLAEDEAHARP